MVGSFGVLARDTRQGGPAIGDVWILSLEGQATPVTPRRVTHGFEDSSVVEVEDAM
jgi:hypothetical protein